MSTIDPEENSRGTDDGRIDDPTTTESEESLDPVGDDVRNEAADGDVLANPDLALDEEPRGTENIG